MSVQNLNEQRSIQSALVLANAATLVSGVVSQIAGNDISNSINGTKATDTLMQTVAHQRILTKLGVK